MFACLNVLTLCLVYPVAGLFQGHRVTRCLTGKSGQDHLQRVVSFAVMYSLERKSLVQHGESRSNNLGTVVYRCEIECCGPEMVLGLIEQLELWQAQKNLKNFFPVIKRLAMHDFAVIRTELLQHSHLLCFQKTRNVSLCKLSRGIFSLKIPVKFLRWLASLLI